MPDEANGTESDSGNAGSVQEEQEATRYPGHEDPDALRERAGLGRHAGPAPEVSPDVAGEPSG